MRKYFADNLLHHYRLSINSHTRVRRSMRRRLFNRDLAKETVAKVTYVTSIEAIILNAQRPVEQDTNVQVEMLYICTLELVFHLMLNTSCLRSCAVVFTDPCTFRPRISEHLTRLSTLALSPESSVWFGNWSSCKKNASRRRHRRGRENRMNRPTVTAPQVVFTQSINQWVNSFVVIARRVALRSKTTRLRDSVHCFRECKVVNYCQERRWCHCEGVTKYPSFVSPLTRCCNMSFGETIFDDRCLSSNTGVPWSKPMRIMHPPDV